MSGFELLARSSTGSIGGSPIHQLGISVTVVPGCKTRDDFSVSDRVNCRDVSVLEKPFEPGFLAASIARLPAGLSSGSNSRLTLGFLSADQSVATRVMPAMIASPDSSNPLAIATR